MQLTIDHETVYRYDGTVSHSTQYLRLTPPENSHQRIISWQLELPVAASQSTDAYGNILHVLTLDTPHSEIHLRAHGVVETCDDWSDEAEVLLPSVFLRDSALTEPDAAIRQLAANHAEAIAADAGSGLTALMLAVADAMPYTGGVTGATTTASDAYALGAGVCQDHSHVFIAACRSLGLPARYVSGYLLSERDTHVASHAWAEVHADGRWQGFDISNRMLPDRHHLKLAVGLDYTDASPVRGVRRGGGSEALQARAQVTEADQQ
ncbi:transglutaminase family protein [Vogesella sp. LIG4]|uniref:transglutaminase family protein n=1 Tax=Vogesella sp. LIG4 TaxID=1192162 RepID=UPI00081FBC70|nr:transglutaminase family protein [Vogesella sp. LIG4]SCK23007.1 Transglutaminase-like enzyme, putative cysteine protease [Vogesella sp. LIG4]